MTKDFKRTDKTAATGQYGLSWVLGGIAVGLLAGAAVYALVGQGVAIPGLANPTANTASTAQVAGATASSTPTGTVVDPLAPVNPADTRQDKAANGPDNRPGFSYHAVLPQLEMGIPISAQEEAAPEEEKAPKTPEPEPAVAAAEPEEPEDEAEQALPQGRYMFQLGAYKTEAQAVQMQKRASQNGLNTRVESADIKGEIWYRVRLGPTDDMNTVNRWKQMLAGMGISAMVIRL